MSHAKILASLALLADCQKRYDEASGENGSAMATMEAARNLAAVAGRLHEVATQLADEMLYDRTR